MKTLRLRLLQALLVLVITLPSPAQQQPRENPGQQYFDARISEARAAIQKNPNSAEDHYLLGFWLSVSIGDRDKARQALLRSYELTPTQSAAALLANSCLSEQSADQASWALRAMAFPTPSLHALAAFESAKASAPPLTPAQAERLRTLRAHRDRWNQELKSHAERLPSLVLTGHEPGRDPHKAWPKGDRRFQVKGQRLVALSAGGRKLWEKTLGEQPLQLVPYGPRLFVIDAKQVRVLDAETGQKLHEWPTAVPLALAEQPDRWSLWEHPDSLVGADDTHLFLQAGRWLCVLRQADAKGWAIYYAQRLRAKLSEDGQVLVTERDYATVEAWSMADGKKLWQYQSGWNYDLRLLDVTDGKVLVSLPDKGQIVALSRSNGQPLWTRSHLNQP